MNSDFTMKNTEGKEREGKKEVRQREIISLFHEWRPEKLTIAEIEDLLKERGYEVDRRTVYRDLEELSKNGLLCKNRISTGRRGPPGHNYDLNIDKVYRKLDEAMCLLDAMGIGPLEDRNGQTIVPKLCTATEHVFTWEHNEELIQFIGKRFGVVRRDTIEHNCNEKRIEASTKEHFLSLELNDDETKAILTVDGVKRAEIEAKRENNALWLHVMDNDLQSIWSTERTSGDKVLTTAYRKANERDFEIAWKLNRYIANLQNYCETDSQAYEKYASKKYIEQYKKWT